MKVPPSPAGDLEKVLVNSDTVKDILKWGSNEIVFDIGPDGVVRYIYSDEAIRLLAGALGRPVINRASHVEYDNERGGWTADMSPLGSKVILGPYDTRDEALAREHTWLIEHMPALLCEQCREADNPHREAQDEHSHHGTAR